MSMKIKELADLLGVSKTAVRNYIDENFREDHMKRDANGVFTIDQEGCKRIADLMGRSDKLPKETENEFAETGENSETITIPLSVWKLMENQIREKDEQLKAKDQQIADLTATVRSQAETVRGEQALHAGTMQKQLEAPRKWRWPWQKGE